MKTKELTIEEKAKAYDRAIANAKEQAIDGYLDAVAVNDIFPELKEGEGEQHRKWILEYLYDGLRKSDEQFKDHFKTAIDWLEKQGEQKGTLCDTCRKAQPSHSCQDITALGRCALEKQGELKPVGWSKEDERDFDVIYGIIYNSCNAEDASRLIAWLKAIKDRVQPQPKQEWNEEDINMIDWLIRCCEKEHEELCNDKYGHQDIVSDLKRDCRKKWDWLESLKNRVAPQKQWKPSDEQLNSLYDVLNPCDGLNRDVLESLYNDLKKLTK